MNVGSFIPIIRFDESAEGDKHKPGKRLVKDQFMSRL